MMIDDDESSGSGVSAAAGFLLGRLSAESAQSTARVAAAVRRRFSSPTRLPYDADDVDGAIATWEAAVARRDATIAELRTQLSRSSANEAALRQHNTALARDNDVLREQIAKHARDIGLMQGGVSNLLAFHEEELSRLRVEIARLKGER